MIKHVRTAAAFAGAFACNSPERSEREISEGEK
jgi:hypothetical protein